LDILEACGASDLGSNPSAGVTLSSMVVQHEENKTGFIFTITLKLLKRKKGRLVSGDYLFVFLPFVC
jgi:hypothetical protein